MNIIVTSKCPIESAQYLDTIRANKFASESAQMMCSALHHYGITAPCKPSHLYHPCSVWVRTSRENYLWLWEHYNALLNVVYERRGTYHKYNEFKWWLKLQAKHLPSLGQTPFVNCAANSEKGISYKHIEDVILAYQLYINHRWDTDKRMPTWE